MSKMRKRRKRHKLSKLLKTLPDIKKRIPIAPPNITFKSKVDYNRSKNKEIANREIDE